MTQHDWDIINYGVWALIIWMTFKQFIQTRRDFKGSGKKLIWGEWLMVAPLPWIIITCINRGTWSEMLWVLAIGIMLAVPYVLTSNFVRLKDGSIRFKTSLLFFVFLFGFPYVRYMVRNKIFHTYPIFKTGTHIPDIELMLALYISILVIYTFVWRLGIYWKFKSVKNDSSPYITVGNLETIIVQK
jgi:hypothetical protein